MAGVDANGQPIIYVSMKFYRGISDIAAFLKINERTAKRLLKEGKIPGKKDGAGKWVFCSLDLK
jgi:TfoX/Sxy family transcriptional regulator of competence genes